MESSNSQTVSNKPLSLTWRLVVWLCRIAVGVTFIFSGWAKAVDVWGFIFKVREYLTVWDWNVPYEAIVIGCGALAIAEFTTGVCIASGCLRRVGVWVAAAIMAFMLPLTAYIMLADPVQDCGCFGEFWIISNTATFLKNVVLAAMIVILLMFNRRVPPLYPAPIQWLVIAGACAYTLTLSLIGYRIQPLVDARPFKTGTYLFEPDAVGGIESEVYIYEKDGREVAFDLFNLPDSTWTFVESLSAPVATPHSLSVFDEKGFMVQHEIAETDSDRLYIIVNHPGMQFLTQAHFANELADFAEAHGVSTMAIIAASPERVKPWRELMRPHYPVYSAEDTSLKELVRGNVAAVYTHEGKISWKLALSAIDSSIPETPSSQNLLANIKPVDDGKLHSFITLILAAWMLFLWVLGQSPKFLRLFSRKKIKN